MPESSQTRLQNLIANFHRKKFFSGKLVHENFQSLKMLSRYRSQPLFIKMPKDIRRKMQQKMLKKTRNCRTPMYLHCMEP
jgi:hypothetical protein